MEKLYDLYSGRHFELKNGVNDLARLELAFNQKYIDDIRANGFDGYEPFYININDYYEAIGLEPIQENDCFIGWKFVPKFDSYIDMFCFGIVEDENLSAAYTVYLKGLVKEARA